MSSSFNRLYKIRLEQQLLFLLLFIALLSSSSCAFYRPTSIHSPILEEKGDMEFAGSMGSTFDASLAYSPINHLAVQASVGRTFGMSYNRIDSSGEEFDKRLPIYQYELAAGYYKPFKGGVLLQSYVGAGRGAGASRILDDDYIFIPVREAIYGAFYDQLFWKVSLHTKLNHKLYLGFAYRLNYMEVNEIKYFDGIQNIAPFDTRARSLFTDQFALELRGDAKPSSFFVQLHFAGGRRYTELLSVRGLGIHFGLNISIGDLFKPLPKKSSSGNDIDKYHRNWSAD